MWHDSHLNIEYLMKNVTGFSGLFLSKLKIYQNCDGNTVAATVLPSQTCIFASGGGKTQPFDLNFCAYVPETGPATVVEATF